MKPMRDFHSSLRATKQFIDSRLRSGIGTPRKEHASSPVIEAAEIMPACGAAPPPVDPLHKLGENLAAQ